MSEPIYLDYNATTPIAREVAAAMRPFLEGSFGNPSSTHRYGVEARKAVERARGEVASLLGCAPDEIVFTSGGSESNNLAIVGTARALADRGRHIVTTAIEHPAVSEVCRWLESEGWTVTTLPVDRHGLVDPAEVEKAITPETVLVTVMHANNEVGTIEPIAEIARIARGRGVRFHSDGAQAVGKIPVNVVDLGVDLYTLAGHKMYAPKGIGVLFVKRGTTLAKLILGADHEQDRRAGTENVLEIVGLGAAAALARRTLTDSSDHLRRMRDRLQQALTSQLPESVVNGHPQHRLPNTLSISFPGIEANTLLDGLEGVAASAGAACHADRVDVSQALSAMGVPVETAMGTIRLTTGRGTTAEEIEAASREIVAAVRRLRGDVPAPRAPGAEDGKTVRLTRYTHGLGCACKIRPQVLEGILSRLPRVEDAALLVGTETSDDAAVYRIAPDLAVVVTVDFFTPIVDDPYDFGAIAASNALSDIYAMGARPILALNLVGFPVGRLPVEVLDRILRGAADKAAEAGIAIVGGHSVEDTEPKFGLAVTGLIDPARIITNRGARPGDILILTKPIGTGILATAAKRGAASPGAVTRMTAVMAELNRAAAGLMTRFPVSACTDVTGFGLLGHLRELTSGSGVEAEVSAAAVPVLEEAMEQAVAGFVPGGSKENLEHVSPHVVWHDTVAALQRLLLCDAQTSGGLLISVPAAEGPAMIEALHHDGVVDAAIVGRITAAGSGRISVFP